MTKGTPASSQIVFLEGRVNDLEENIANKHVQITDLEAALAEMTQQRDSHIEAHEHIYNLMCQRTNELVASQALVARLREALECARLKTDPKYGWPILDAALVLPADDTALKQYGAKVLREAAAKARSHSCGEYNQWGVGYRDGSFDAGVRIDRMADELSDRADKNGSIVESNGP